LGVSLPNSVLQPLYQQLKDDGETVGLSLSQILEGDLAAIEGIDHWMRGHTALLSEAGWRHGQAWVSGHVVDNKRPSRGDGRCGRHTSRS
jgi:hypothetical protein